MKISSFIFIFFVCFFTSLVASNYKSPDLIIQDDSREQNIETYPNIERTHNENETIQDNFTHTQNSSLLDKYKKVNKPSFVILYNRILDDEISSPVFKTTIANKYEIYEINEIVFSPINGQLPTLTQEEFDILNNSISDFFMTNNIKMVDRTFLLRLGKLISYQNEDYRAIEIKSLRMGADYLFEISFDLNKDFKIKIINLENGEVAFSRKFTKAKDGYRLSSNNDFSKIKNNNFEKNLFTAMDSVSKGLMNYWENHEQHAKKNRFEKQKESLHPSEKNEQYKKTENQKKKEDSSKIKTTGSGFFISSNGHILTNNHVILNSSKISVNFKNNEKKKKIIAIDKNNDIAILKIDLDDNKYLPLMTSDKILKGEEVCALGFPLIDIQGNELKATFGNINSLAGLQDDHRFYQVDSAIQPGNSGGPLMDMKGSVIGIITSKLNQQYTYAVTKTLNQNVNYALKIDYTLPIIKKFNISYNEGEASSSMSSAELVKKVSEAVVLIVSK